MKALRIILVIIGALVAAMLLVPLFVSSTTEVSAETEIALEPSRIFSTVASFKNRDAWDPWVRMDSTTTVTIDPKAGYVGSTYAWDGEKLGTGKMEVIAVTENEYIRSSLWFGEVEEPSLVEWNFDPVEGGTHVVWSFKEETTYPFERLGMMFGKLFLKQSFESGIAQLKDYAESMPSQVSTLGPISVTEQQPIAAMVADGGGTIETIGEQMGQLYGLLMMELERQQLEMAGAPFAHYLDFGEATGHTNYRAGIPVLKTGQASGEVYPHSYSVMRAVQAMHSGPYEELHISYAAMEQYMQSNGLVSNGEVFEFYLTDPESEPDPAKWQTLISFILKEN